MGGRLFAKKLVLVGFRSASHILHPTTHIRVCRFPPGDGFHIILSLYKQTVYKGWSQTKQPAGCTKQGMPEITWFIRTFKILPFVASKKKRFCRL
jgi:hypothetical protein